MLPVRRVEERPKRPLPRDGWPATVPAVAQLLADGLDLGPLTILVGENGTGKSTIVEAIAQAYGLNASGGSRHALPESDLLDGSRLASSLQIVRSAGVSRWGYFLRAETMYNRFTEQVRDQLDPQAGGRITDPNFMQQSHGESFLGLLNSNRYHGPGFYLFDEPESALSFTAQLSLVGQLHELADSGRAQVLLSTHSPVLAAVPGARLLELGEWGWRETRWEDLAMVDHYRRFTQDPDAYLHHIIGQESR